MRSQFLALGTVEEEAVEEEEEGLHLGVEDLCLNISQIPADGHLEHFHALTDKPEDSLSLRTFFLAGSVTPDTIRFSSFRIVLAATPVVADLKSYSHRPHPETNERIK